MVTVAVVIGGYYSGGCWSETGGGALSSPDIMSRKSETLKIKFVVSNTNKKLMLYRSIDFPSYSPAISHGIPGQG